MIQSMEIPKQVGAYRLISLLGKGPKGFVYKGVHGPLNRPVALKVIHTTGKDPEFEVRYLREMERASRIDHPNVASILDAGSAEGLVYCAMRYMAGGDLTRQFQIAKRFSEKKSLTIAFDIAQALAAVHRAGLTHREIKPTNILLQEDGPAALGDLGAAAAWGIEAGVQRLATSAAPPHAAAYLAPEIAKGTAEVDIRADLFSLGTVLFQMSTGASPFEGTTPFETLSKLLYEPAPDPRRLTTSLSSGVAAVISRLLKKNPDERFQTPDELLEALGQLSALRSRSDLVASPVEAAPPAQTASDSASRPSVPSSRDWMKIVGSASPSPSPSGTRPAIPPPPSSRTDTAKPKPPTAKADARPLPPIEEKKDKGSTTLFFRNLVGRVVDMVSSPSSSGEMVFSGQLSEGNMLEVMQFIHSSSKSGELQVRGEGITGVVAFRSGSAFFAETERNKGEVAVFECVQAKSGSFRFAASDPPPTRPVNIVVPTMQLLLECARHNDER